MGRITTATAGEVAYLPNQPRAPMRETLEWKTDLFESQNGTQTGIALRSAPRRSLMYTVPESHWMKARAFNTQYGALDQLWAVPLWAEAQYVGAIAASAASIAVPTATYDFRDASLAFIYQDEESFQLVDIATVGSDVLNLEESEIETAAYKSAWVMPARLGYVARGFDRQINGHDVLTDVTFELDDNVAFSEGSAPAQFLSNDIYFDPIFTDNERTPHDLTTRIDVTDNELGLVARRYPWTYNRIERNRRMIAADHAETYAIRQWLSRRQGRLIPFWEPSFQDDVRVKSTGAITTTIQVRSDNLGEWGLRRTHWGFCLDDGSWLARTVSSPTIIDPDTLQLTLNASLGVNASRIRHVSFLGLKRLAADRVELNFEGGGVSRVAVNTMEIQP